MEAMSIELEDAKVNVPQFQKQCEEYLVVLVPQKREADKQQKFVSICLSVGLSVSYSIFSM